MRCMRLSVFGVLALAAALAAPAGATDAAEPLAIHYTACKSAVNKPVNKCIGPYSLGIPSTIPRVYFFATGSGLFKKGGIFKTEILDATKQPVISPVIVRVPVDLKGLLWYFSLNGPFPKQTIYLQAKFNGKALGQPQLFRFV